MAEINISPLLECTKIDTNIGIESILLSEKNSETKEIVPNIHLDMRSSTYRKLNYINQIFSKYDIQVDQLSLDIEPK
ncbi:hypothetical protein [Staphylococcus auricularis]|uniref:hypothetical protein n=1 Tax=Staphylococcus auricularis TaxID=29379 RepID=UPI001F1A9357|nr:hypothetical protein [Staphylococcus auricularis]MCE5038991.1 hypothetical protein [Staphylococcus auricularis]MEB6571090.1 hypothetical protein [Staphylococcus auricularis]